LGVKLHIDRKICVHALTSKTRNGVTRALATYTLTCPVASPRSSSAAFAPLRADRRPLGCGSVQHNNLMLCVCYECFARRFGYNIIFELT
jgi:hypothetical protein